MYWQACPYSRQHSNKLPESFSFFCRQSAVASLCCGGRADPELAPAAFQELAHADTVADVPFCSKTVPSETSCAIKTKQNRYTFVKFWMVIEFWILAEYPVLKAGGKESEGGCRVEIQLAVVYSLS